MQVFIITSGEYSDYHINQVFSTEEKAQEFLDHIKDMYGTNGNYYTVNVYDVDRVLDRPQGHLPYQVRINKDGNRSTVYDISIDDMYDKLGLQPYHSGYMSIKVWAKDEQHAIKIANEHRVQAIANGTWKTL